MITVQLTKLESALEQVRKTYPKLKPADAGLIATALVLTGRHAIAVHGEERYTWPNDIEPLTRALAEDLKVAQGTIEPPKKVLKNAPEEEPIQLTINLVPNLAAGEAKLGKREDLKTLLSDTMQKGVEYTYQAGDLGWQWALDRTNWKTVGGSDLSRRIKIKASFSEGAIGTELGLSASKKKVVKSKGSIAVVDVPDMVELPIDDSISMTD